LVDIFHSVRNLRFEERPHYEEYICAIDSYLGQRHCMPRLLQCDSINLRPCDFVTYLVSHKCDIKKPAYSLH